MRYSREISIAVAAAVGASGAVSAAPPNLSQAAIATNTLYMAGSSAAKNAIFNTLENQLCGGVANTLTVASGKLPGSVGSGNFNFFALSCFAASTGPSAVVGQSVTVYYRDEGGSVVGILPLVSGKTVTQLNLNDAANIPCASGATFCTANVTGSSATNGITDSFKGAVTKQAVQLGITDLEPTVFVNDNYPTAYSTSVYGTASASQLGDFFPSPLFQQVFGVFVNVSGGLFGSPQPTSLNIPKSVLTNLFQGNVTDWSQASNTSGTALASSSETVHILNREAGSGSRAGASIYFTNYGCSPLAVDIADPAGATGDYFSTADVLVAANTTPGAITYASIDNFNVTTYPNLALVAINGVYPSNFNAAVGQYDYWFEATAVPASNLSGSSAALSNWLIGELQYINTEPHLIDVNTIPGNLSVDIQALPVSSTANTQTSSGQAIYVSQFTRAGVSCNSPLDTL